MAHSKLHSSPDVRLPITRSVLQDLVLALNHTNSSAFQRLLYQTMFLVAFYGFFRVGELTVNGANLKSLVHVQDLHFQFSNNVVTSATIVIKDFKHNTTRRPFSVFLECAEGSTLCPVAYLQHYFSTRGATPGPLFCFADGSPVKTSQFMQQLQQALNFCDLDSTKYKSHSFWIGAASLAAEKRLSDAQIIVTLAVGNLTHLNYTFANLREYLRIKLAFQSWAGPTHISRFCLFYLLFIYLLFYFIFYFVLVTLTRLRHGLVVSY